MNKKDIKIAKIAKIEKSSFDEDGGMFNFEIPKDCDLIILAGNKGGGYIPYNCLLPHQVYLSDIKETFEKEHFEVIFMIPFNSKEPSPIAFNGDYGQQRWENKHNHNKDNQTKPITKPKTIKQFNIIQAICGGFLSILIYIASLIGHNLWLLPLLFLAGFVTFLNIETLKTNKYH